MMQSVALNESCYHDDDDYVVVVVAAAVETACSRSADPMAGILDISVENDGDDDASYDYCDDVFNAVPSIIAGPTISFDGDSSYLYSTPQGFDDDDEEQEQVLLELASSMLNEITEMENERDSTGDIPISSTKPEFEPSSPSKDEPQMQITSVIPYNRNQEALLEADAVVKNHQGVDLSAAVSKTETFTAQNNAAPVSESSLQIQMTAKEIKVKQKEANTTSRLTNKKRRKQVKLSKKSAAAAANLAQMTVDPSSPMSPTRRKITSLRSGKKQQVAPNVTVSYCATQSLELFSPKHNTKFVV